jgi:superfamily II DNA/RNA helicase
MSAGTSTPIPVPGQLVRVRQRPFVVSDVQASHVPPLPLSGSSTEHLITLRSVEDESLGDDLRIVWELELGSHTIAVDALPEPTGFDDARTMNAFVDAVRWGAISSADVRTLQSPFRSGIEIEDYQLDPVARAIQMPRVNLLIADDVGLGKTIEAGLVTYELLLRNRVRTVLIVCPASIQLQWKEQLREKFGLDFQIVDSELMRQLRRRRGLHVNPWTHFPRLITSIDFLKRDRPMRLFREVLPPEGEASFPRRFDLMILDEAHNAAPAAPSTGRYAIDSLRTAAIRTLADHFEHKLFLSATPHNGYIESFTALLALLDNQRFAVGIAPDDKQKQAIMIRRMKSDPDLELRADGTRRFARADVEALPVKYTEAERRAHRALQEYTVLRQKSARTPADRFACEFVLKLLKKRLFSSPAAFEITLARHAQTGKQSAPSAPSSIRALQQQLDLSPEDSADDEAIETSLDDSVEVATRALYRPSAGEASLLAELTTFANSASARGDSKSNALIEWLEANIKPDGQWSDNRVIIFTEYRATQKWLYQLLVSAKLGDPGRLQLLYGGMKHEDRERIKAAFQAAPADAPVRILLATDAASEGINLQNHCSRLIHYEIPWNPNRMEQRNGRIHRHGQKSPTVQLCHFVGAGFKMSKDAAQTPVGELEGDLEFLMRAVIKVNAIREDLGKVGPVIAEQVEEAMLGKRTKLDTVAAEKQNEPVKAMLKLERRLREQIEKLGQQLDESRIELHVNPENLRAVVQAGLDLARQPGLKAATLAGVWPDPTGKRKACPIFSMPALTGGWADATGGIEHPHTKKLRPITFDHTVAAGRDDVVLVHLNHKLVQMAVRLLRAEVWDRGSRKRLHRVSVQMVADAALDSPAIVAFGRLVVLGGDGQRLTEEVIEIGGRIRDGRFARLNVGETTAVLAGALPERAPDTAGVFFAESWSTHKPSLQKALDGRALERAMSMQGALDERAAKEIADITAVLGQLERGIRQELARPEDAQLKLFSDVERDQHDRNVHSLRERLARIPMELLRETDAIKARYARPTTHVFPIAVTFLVPKSLSTKLAASPTAGGRR